MRYNRLNNLVGWLVFATAFITYTATVEPTASFWDCGEFIATANELEVPHPPGAPLHLLTARLFAMVGYAFGGVTAVAFAVNMLSVTVSAFMALFIVWTTTILAKKILAPNTPDPDAGTRAIILFAGAIAGLTCTFIDTVWFNAVEAEVYAYSSFFTTAVFWLILKWEARADEPGSIRWIIFIAYVIGLAVGVHLLPLLTIPALGLIYYFRKYKYSRATFLGALGLFLVILVVIQVGVIQKTWDVAWAFERLFTGSETIDGKNQTGFGLPYGAGAAFFALVLFGSIATGIWYTQKRKLPAANTALICLLMVYLGFSSYAIIFIRSNADPAIDQNHPGNVINFISYVKREQYGSKPLAFGQMYNSRIVDYTREGKNYISLDGHKRYIFDGYKRGYKYEPGSERFFPRMYDAEHYASGPYGYQNYVSDKGADLKDPFDDKPTGLDNLAFFFDYQVNHMYLRYLMWNFVGREDDYQHARWESGVELARFEDMPEDMRNKPTRNHYFALPLLLGLLGLFWHFQNDPKRAGVVLSLFFLTGLAIVLYLNQVAQEPRERDYAFVGSYHTFTIWVGLGVIAVAQLISKLAGRASPYIAGGLCLILVPGNLLAKNWDDHNRSGRYIAPDSAYNLLNSCEPNAIIFTNGDNDTFPLWYIQEVEGVRTDVRVVNLSLLNTDWYIYQLKHKKWNNSEPVPITLPEEFYFGEKNALIRFTRRTISFPVDKESLVRNGVVSVADTAKVVSPMLLPVKPRGEGENTYLMKQDYMILNILENIAKDGWKRPIYFANTVGPSNFLSLDRYFELQGVAMRIVPINDPANEGLGRMNLPVMYNNVVNKFRYRGLNDPSLFFDENVQRMIGNFRGTFFRLSSGLIEEADAISKPDLKNPEQISPNTARADSLRAAAQQVMTFAEATISDQAVPTPTTTLYLYSQIYNRLGDKASAERMMTLAKDRAFARLRYAKTQNLIGDEDSRDDMYVLRQIMTEFYSLGRVDVATDIATQLLQLAPDEQSRQQYKQLIEQWQKLPPANGDTSSPVN